MAAVEEQAPPKKRRKLFWVGVLFMALVVIGIGWSIPLFLLADVDAQAKKHAEQEAKPAFMKFGDVSVNLSEERLTRYIRVKMILVTTEAQEKQVAAVVEQKKAILRNWLISYLSDRSVKDVTGTAGFNRVRREIQDQFNSMLFPDGPERIREVLFEEFLVN